MVRVLFVSRPCLGGMGVVWEVGGGGGGREEEMGEEEEEKDHTREDLPSFGVMIATTWTFSEDIVAGQSRDGRRGGGGVRLAG